MGDDKRKVSAEQLDILIKAIERDPSLVSNRAPGPSCRSDFGSKWERLAKKLNSVENGAYKNVGKWQQTWRDCKANTKKKALRISKERSDDSSGQELNELERRIMKICVHNPDKHGMYGTCCPRHTTVTGCKNHTHPPGRYFRDINNIAELDPFSSGSREDSDETDNIDGTKCIDILTLYSNKAKCDKNTPPKRAMSKDATAGRQQAEILTRLDSIEQTQQRLVQIAETQSQTLNRIARLLSGEDVG